KWENSIRIVRHGFLLMLLLWGTVETGYGQTRTYLTGQKTGKLTPVPGISLGTGSADISEPMTRHLLSFYYGNSSILNGIHNDPTTVRAAQDLGLFGGILGAGGN